MGLTLNAFGRILVGQKQNSKQFKHLKPQFSGFLNCRSQVQSLPWSPPKPHEFLHEYSKPKQSYKSLKLPILCTKLHDAHCAFGRILVGWPGFAQSQNQSSKLKNSIGQWSGFALPRAHLCEQEGEMARINIEECWWTDPRRKLLAKLVGDENAADGLAIQMWRLAQEFWGRGQKRVPLEIFETIEAASKLIEAKLAIVEADSVYVRGSSQYLDWINDKRRAGQEGGKQSAKVRAKKHGSAQPQKAKKPKKIEADSKQPRSKVKQPEPSGSGSGSGSGSDSGSKISFPSETTPQTDCGAAVAKKPSSGVKANFLIARYCEWFKSKYGFNPDIMQKQAGIAKRISKSMTEERMAKLLDAYFNMPEGWLEKRKHPLELFEMKLNEIAAFAENGQFTTTGQVRSLDQGTNVHSQLERIRRGEL